MKYYLIAGEASGDLHGSLLMQALSARDPQAEFRFRGGDAMAAVSGTRVQEFRDTAVMGIVEVLAKAGSLGRNLASCKRDILAWSPDAVILIDYPGFNLKIASFAHEAGFKVFYYIAPKVWATRERRVEKLRRYVDKLFVVFPFEVEWFRARGIEPVYEGNPLAEFVDKSLAIAPSREEFLRFNNLEDKPLLALLPGSRLQEIRWLAPRFAALTTDPRLEEFQFVIAGAPGISPDTYADYLPGTPVVSGQTYSLLKHASAAAVASGTASLETAIIGTPQVVCYGTNPLTYRIAKAFLKVKYVSLVNLIAGKPVVRELLQRGCTPAAIADELLSLTGDDNRRSRMFAEYTLLRRSLGDTGSAGRIAAELFDSI